MVNGSPALEKRSTEEEMRRVTSISTGSHDDGDLISELPEELKHTILSLLPTTKDVVRASLLSKSWHRVFSAFPVFEYSLELPWKREEGRITFLPCQERIIPSFVNFVHKSLLLRRSKPIPKFRLSMPDFDDIIFNFAKTYPAVDKCLDLLDMNVIKELDLAFDSSHWYRLPPSIYSDSNSLTILRLARCRLLQYIGGIEYVCYCSDDLPPDVFNPINNSVLVTPWNWRSLRQVHLKRVYFRQNFLDNFISASPSLEELSLLYCEQPLTFTLPPTAFAKLKKLKLKFDWALSSFERIEIHVPSLQRFSLKVDVEPEIPKVCDLHFTSCKNLEFLELKGLGPVQDADQYCQHLVSQFPVLNTFLFAKASPFKPIYRFQRSGTLTRTI